MKKIHLAFLLALTLLVSACTTTGWVVGALVGAGAAAYYVRIDERTAGGITDDIVISAAVTAKFVKNEQVSALNIQVNTYKGTVTLYGSVPNASIERQAMLLAADVKGVKKVVSKIKVVDGS